MPAFADSSSLTRPLSTRRTRRSSRWLARPRARIGAAEGAAVRDTDGRTYAAATVELASCGSPRCRRPWPRRCPAGAAGLEAAAVVTAAGSIDPASLSAVRDLAPAAPVLLADPAGTVRETLPG